VKIGWTSGDPRKRLSALQSGSPQRLELLGVIAGGPDVEQRLHAFNAPWRVGGEWFRVTSDLIDEIDWSVDWPAEQHAAAKQMGSVRDCEQCASYLAFTRAIQDLYPDA
jgi:hypothetical protein